MCSRLRLKTAEKSDKRISLMSEIINGIKVIKMYAWENPFATLISNARKDEIQTIGKNTYIQSINMGFFFVVHKLIMLAILVAFLMAEDKVLVASEVFLTQSLYYTVSLSVTRIFPDCVQKFVESQVSIRRIQKFLEANEVCLR